MTTANHPPTRRGFLTATAGLVFGGTTEAFLSPLGLGPDAGLLMLSKEFDRRLAICREMDQRGASDSLFASAHDACVQVAEEMIPIPAGSVAGLQSKARLWRWMVPDGGARAIKDHRLDLAVTASVFADVERMGVRDV